MGEIPNQESKDDGTGILANTTSEEVEASSIGEQSKNSIDDIISDIRPNQVSFNDPSSTQPNTPEIPLGDNLQGDPNNTPSITSPPQESILPLPSSNVLNELDSLEKDIDEASLPENTSAESIRSFKGLKARYKNQMQALREEVKNFETNNSALTRQLQEANQYKDSADKLDNVSNKLTQVEEQLELLKRENETLSYFRKKYDLEGDPQIQNAFLKPMQQLKDRSWNILENNGFDKDFLNKLLTSKSDFEVNSLIDDAGITGLNAQSLKSYVVEYQNLESDFNKHSDPEYIDATLKAAKGHSITVSDNLAKEVFDNMKTSFSEHVKELQESGINKEHNFFVHDKVVEQATKSYSSLRKALGNDYQNQGVMSAIAQAALMTSAYPYQSRLLDHALKTIENLTKELEESSSGPELKQTSGSSGTTTPSLLQNLDSLRQEAKTDIDTITKTAFTS